MIFSSFFNFKSNSFNQALFRAFILCILIFLVLPRSVQAVEASGITVRGFGTFGGTRLTETNRYLDFLKNEKKGTYFSSNTTLGINLTDNFQENTRVVVQGIMLGSQNNADPQLDLAFVARRIPTLDLELVLGRVVAPIWLFSEEQSVGFNYIWIRPPTELYETAPIRNLDGIGFRYSPKVSTGDILLQAFYGESNNSNSDEYKGPNGLGGLTNVLREYSTSLREAFTSEIRYQMTSLLLRAGYSRANISQRNSLTIPGTPASVVISVPETEEAEMSSFGLSGEWEGIHYAAETAKLKVGSTSIGNFEGSYMTLGYKYADFLTYASSGKRSNLSGDYYIVSSDPLASARLTESTSMSVGLNYYGLDNLVLKVGVTKYDESYDQVITGTTQDGNQFDVYSLLFDFIF